MICHRGMGLTAAIRARCARQFSAMLMVLGLAGCGSDGDGNGNGNAGGSSGAGGGGNTGGSGGGSGASCSGTVSGDVTAEFSGCVSTINAFTEGTPDMTSPYWIYTLVAAPEASSELDPPLESLGINLWLAGAPAPGSYTASDALPDTDAHLYAPFPTAYQELVELSLNIDGIEQVNESDDLGYHIVVYDLDGSFDMVLADDAGTTVTVTSSF